MTTEVQPRVRPASEGACKWHELLRQGKVWPSQRGDLLIADMEADHCRRVLVNLEDTSAQALYREQRYAIAEENGVDRDTHELFNVIPLDWMRNTELFRSIERGL